MTTKKHVELLGEVAKLSLMINMQTRLCMFVEYAGHCDLLDIRIAASKDTYTKILLSVYIYHITERPASRLRRIIKDLEKMLETGTIPKGVEKRWKS